MICLGHLLTGLAWGFGQSGLLFYNSIFKKRLADDKRTVVDLSTRSFCSIFVKLFRFLACFLLSIEMVSREQDDKRSGEEKRRRMSLEFLKMMPRPGTKFQEHDS